MAHNKTKVGDAAAANCAIIADVTGEIARFLPHNILIGTISTFSRVFYRDDASLD